MQQMKEMQENVIEYNGYTFIYENPENLVGLQKIQKIIPLMFNVAKNSIIWITKKIEECLMPKVLMNLPKKTFESISKAQQYIKTKASEPNEKFIIILQFSVMFSQLRMFQREDIAGIIFYRCGEEINKQNTGFKKYCCYIENEQELLKEINYFKLGQLQSKQLPNFVESQKDKEASSIVIETMKSMLNLKQSSKVRAKIIARLQKLVKQICEQNKLYQNFPLKMEKFIKDLEAQLTPERAIYWYTTQSPVYRIVNNLLRSSRHPFQIYYIQPYFKDLFNAVNRLYHLQKNRYSNIVLYRGGMASNKEIQFYFQNVGKNVQNLSFLSTSFKCEVAQNHIINILLEISVPAFCKDQAGFAHIQKNSAYLIQEEVLFNPMNSFKIIEAKYVKKFNKQILHVNLQFEEINKRKFNNEKYRLSYERLHGWEHCQGSYLINNNFYLQGTEQFWQVFTKISEQMLLQKYQKRFIFRRIGYIFLADIQRNIGNYEKAIKYHKHIQSLIKELQQKPQMLIIPEQQLKNYLLDTYLDLSELYFDLKCYQSSLSYYQLIQKWYFQYQVPQLILIKILRVKASIFQQSNKLCEAEQCMKIYEKILIKNYGTQSLDYALKYLIFSANLALKMKDYKKSEQLMKLSQKIILKQVGEQNFHYSTVLYNIGTIYLKQGRYNKALQYFQNSFKKIIKYQWKNNFHMSNSDNLNTVAYVYYLLGNVTKSIQLYMETKHVCLKVVNCTNFMYYEHVLKILFVCYINIGDYGMALKCLEECRHIDISQKEQSFFKYSIENFAAKIYRIIGIPKLALKYYEITKQILQKNKNRKYVKDIQNIEKNRKEIKKQRKSRLLKNRKINNISFRQLSY